MLYLLRDEVTKDAGKNLLKTAEDEVARLAETAQRTLDLARGGKHPPKQLMIDEFLKEIAVNIKLPKAVPLQTRFQAGLWVNVVPGELRQAIYNLLLNAAQFTPPGEQVKLSCTRRGNVWRSRSPIKAPASAKNLAPRSFSRTTPRAKTAARVWGSGRRKR